MKLYGKNPVVERIKAKPQSIKKLYLQKKTDLSLLVKEAKKAHLTFESVDRTWFKDRCGDLHTQGVMAEVDEFEYAPFPDILEVCFKGDSTLIFLDGVEDPQNLGSIIRNLACLGSFSLVLSQHGAVHVTETVLRVANGGENYVKVAKVASTSNAVRKAKEKGFTVLGASVCGEDITQADFTPPVCIIIGSEGKGIRPALKKLIDAELTLPMKGAALSYNVASAALLFCYELERRK